MPTIRIANGLNIYYRESGRGSRTLLLIHGNTASSLWWERVMALLPAGVRVLAPDLRGCGESDKPAAGWSMADLAEDVYQFLQALGVARAAVAGHSLGGGAALQLAVAHPEVTERLVLINPAPTDGLRTPPERYGQLEMAIMNPELLKLALAAMMPTAPQDEYYHRLLNDSVAKSATALIRNGRALDRMDVTAQARAIQVPVLIIYGRQDRLITQEMMECTRDAIPGAVLEQWEEVGHSAPVEAPARVARRLSKFLEQ